MVPPPQQGQRHHLAVGEEPLENSCGHFLSSVDKVLTFSRVLVSPVPGKSPSAGYRDFPS